VVFGRSHTNDQKGAGLARGPAYIIGAILAAFGLVLLLKAGDTPTAGFPDADVDGVKFLGFETNGWTAWLTTAAGVLLLFGSAQHLLAKGFSLAVGLALGACATIALIDGDVLGLAAANWATELGWGIAAVLLVLNVLSPRVDGDDGDRDDRRTVFRDRRDRSYESGAVSADAAAARDGRRDDAAIRSPHERRRD
jgi:hypothetical protein